MSWGVCAYCGKPGWTHQDHVIPRSLARRAPEPIPADLAGTVPACKECNWLKGTRCLVPPAWAGEKLARLQALFSWKKWRVWHGDVREPAYVEAVA